MNKQIIFIAGVLTSKKTLKKIKLRLKKINPKYKIIIIGENYSYFEINKMLNIKKQLIKLISNNNKTILIGHSFGGIIINSALNEKNNYNVKKIISIFSPYKLNLFGMKKRKEILNYSKIKNKNINIKSFGAYFDFIVPFFLTKLENKNHKNYFVDHYWFFFRNNKFFNKIILEGMKNE